MAISRVKKKPPITLYVLLVLLIGCAIVAFLSGSLDTAGYFNNTSSLLKSLFWPLIKATVFISMGLFAGLIIEGMGWTDRLAVIARPFMRWGHLSDQMGAAFTTAFISGTSSLSMLKSFYKEGSMSRREITLSILLNTFPSFFLHLPRTFFILLALVGRAGALYVALTFAAAVLRFVTVLLYAHFILPEPQSYQHIDAEPQKKEWRVLFRESGKKFGSQLSRILLIVLPVYLIVVLISDMGFFLWLRESMARVISSQFIPIEAMSIVIFSLMAELTSGYAAAGAMLEAGALTVVQTVMALIVGYIIASPVRALRHQMPYYMGIFEPVLGARLMLFNQAFRVGSMLITGFIFVYCIT